MIFKVFKILAENGYRYYIEFSLSQRIRRIRLSLINCLYKHRMAISQNV